MVPDPVTAKELRDAGIVIPAYIEDDAYCSRSTLQGKPLHRHHVLDIVFYREVPWKGLVSSEEDKAYAAWITQVGNPSPKEAFTSGYLAAKARYETPTE